LNPDYFQLAATYRLNIRFVELPPAPQGASIKVTAKATDARGKTGEARYP